jgi:hypothetical protein
MVRSQDSQFGVSVSLSGEYALVGSDRDRLDAGGGNSLPAAGSAFIFTRDSAGVWQQVQKIVPSTRGSNSHFGFAADITENYLIVGAYSEDRDSAGTAVSDAGAAFVFAKDSSGIWSEVSMIAAGDRQSGDLFGYAVAISECCAVVGSFADDEDQNGTNTLDAAGSAYIFEPDSISGNWLQVAKVVPPEREARDEFGKSVDCSNDAVLVSAFKEDHDENGYYHMDGAGSAYVFRRDSSGPWSFNRKLVAPDRSPLDEFGSSVAISDSLVIVGARLEDEDASGGSFVDAAGSVYVFSSCEVDASASMHADTLWANSPGMQYQWMRCDSLFSPIPGATNQSFVPTFSGSYAVIVARGTCSDTSECQTAEVPSVFNTLEMPGRIWPNPTNGTVYIHPGLGFDGYLVVLAATGTTQILRLRATPVAVNLEGPAGLYCLTFVSPSGMVSVSKVLKL